MTPTQIAFQKIKNEILEEAAKACEERGMVEGKPEMSALSRESRFCAAAVRALKTALAPALSISGATATIER